MTDQNELRAGSELQVGEIFELKRGEIVHKFEIEGKLNLEMFSQGKSEMVDAVDVGDLANFARAAKNLDLENIRFQLERTDSGFKKNYLMEILRSGKILPVRGMEIRAPYFYHAGCSIFLDNNGKIIQKVDQMKSSGIYGSSERVGYFSDDRDEALAHGLGNFNEVTQREKIIPEARILFLVIDVAKLLEKRSIFIDPESLLLGNEEEFNKNFVVHKGIPVSAIKDVLVLKYKGRFSNPDNWKQWQR